MCHSIADQWELPPTFCKECSSCINFKMDSLKWPPSPWQYFLRIYIFRVYGWLGDPNITVSTGTVRRHKLLQTLCKPKKTQHIVCAIYCIIFAPPPFIIFYSLRGFGNYGQPKGSCQLNKAFLVYVYFIVALFCAFQNDEYRLLDFYVKLHLVIRIVS